MGNITSLMHDKLKPKFILTSLYGSIGYTYLMHDKLKPTFILVLSDNHSKLPYCDNYKMVSEWLKEKVETNNILLEEVPRDDTNLKELFSDSDHTQKLKELFINNPKLINGIDIRPLLIDFSWELLGITEIPEIIFSKYLETIDEFFNFNNKDIKQLNKNYIENSPFLNIQFMIIKKIYNDYKTKYMDLLDQPISYIYTKFKFVLEELNSILDNIMEFYVILNIFKPRIDNKNIIIHTGLAHSEKIIYWLTTIYSYKIIEEKGITSIENSDKMPLVDGCIKLSNSIDDQLSKMN